MVDIFDEVEKSFPQKESFSANQDGDIFDSVEAEMRSTLTEKEMSESTDGDFITGIKQAGYGAIASHFGSLGLYGSNLAKGKDQPFLKTLNEGNIAQSIINIAKGAYKGEDIFDLIAKNNPLIKKFQASAAMANRVGDVIGVDVAKHGEELRDFGIDKYSKYTEEAGKHKTKTLRDVKEAEGFANTAGTFIDWAQGGLGKLVPTMAETIIGTLVGGGVTGIASRTVLKKSIEKAATDLVENQIKKGLIKEGTEKLAEKEIKKVLTNEVLKKSREELTKIGGKAGMGATVLPLEAGGNYGEVFTEKGIDAPETALLFGTLATALEYVGGNVKIIDKLVDAIGGSGKAVKTTVKELLKNIPAEALQEAGQESLSILNTMANTDEKFLTPENIERIIEAGAIGALGGGVGIVPKAAIDIISPESDAKGTSEVDKMYENIVSHGEKNIATVLDTLDSDIEKINTLLNDPKALHQEAEKQNILVSELTEELQSTLDKSTELKNRLKETYDVETIDKIDWAEKEKATQEMELRLQELQETEGLTDEELYKKRAEFYDRIWGYDKVKDAEDSFDVFAPRDEKELEIEESLKELQKTEGLTDEEVKQERARLYEELWGRPLIKDAERSAEVFTDISDEEYKATEKAIIQKHLENIMLEADPAERQRAYEILFAKTPAEESFDIFNKTDLITREGKPYQRRKYLEGYLSEMPDADNWDIAEVPGGYVGIRKIVTSEHMPKDETSTFTDEQQVGDAINQSVDQQLEKEDINLEPSEAQKEAGNYKKASVNIDGFKVKVENPAGSERSGRDEKGNEWTSQMASHYGYFERTEGKDGDQVDVFIKPGTTSSPQVYIVDQINPETGKFDEHKVIMGATSEQEAKDIYLSNYEEGWKGLGNVTEMDQARFKEWLGDSKRTKKPAFDAQLETREKTVTGRGLKREEIQKMFPGQNVFFGDNNTVSIRLKNGKGITFQTIQDAGKGFIEFAIQTGQMSEDGKILGITVGNKVLIDKEFADTHTGWHENLHVVENLGMITPTDNALLNAEFNKLRESGKLDFELSKHNDPIQRMKENRANTFAQVMVNREQYRNTPLGALVQKVKDFFDQLYVFGKRVLDDKDFQTISGLAREFETGKFYERPANNTTIKDFVDVDTDTVKTFPQLTSKEKTSTKTQAFREWFGKSVMRNKETDEPMIFYHYKNTPTTVLKHTPGANTGHASSGLGFFFMGKKDPTYHYGQYEIAGYLKMEKPYKMSADEAASFETVNAALAKQEELRNLGYDGIVIDNSKVDGLYVGGDPHFVIFDNTQIKSIYNEGTWDITNEDINLETREPVKESKISDEEILDIHRQRSNLLQKIQRSTRMKMSEVKLMADKALTPISTRLKKIDMALAMKMRAIDFRTGMKVNRVLKEAYPILKTKMSAIDKTEWDWVRKNGDVVRINKLAEKYGFKDKYDKLRETLNQLRQDAIDVGYDVGFIEEYWPRIIKDQEGFLQATQGISRNPDFSKALKDKADKLGISVNELRDRYPDVTADIISNLILGRSSGIGGPGNIQGRIFDKIPREYAEFYMNSDAALMQYIYSMTKKIEARRFFGKVSETINKKKQERNLAETSLLNIEKQIALLSSDVTTEEQQKQIDLLSQRKELLHDKIKEADKVIEKYKQQRDYTENIGAYINDLIIQGKLHKNDEKALREILEARFNERGTTGVVHNYKNVSYIMVMGNINSAITQIGDLAWAAYVGKAWTPKGFVETTKNLAKSVFKQSNITKEDLGIERMAQEFADYDSFSNIVSIVFRSVGLEKMDSIGKEVLINNVFTNYKNQVQTEKGRQELLKKIRPTFGKESNQVINDLIANVPSENVKMLLYSRLLDFQPVALSEMPEYYLKGGNWRILYMLKTYTIKQFDVFRNEVYREYKNGNAKQKLNAVKNLVQLLGVLTLANAGADELKDIILGKEIKLSDNIIENLYTIGGANRYVRMQARREGIGTAATQMVLPPYQFINDFGKDVTDGSFFSIEESRSLQNLPVIGKLAYWHVGRGSEYRPSIEEQDFRKAGKKFRKFKEKFEEAKDKHAFLTSNIEDFKQMKVYESFSSSIRKLTTLINKLEKLEQTTNVRKRIGQLKEQQDKLRARYFELINE